MSTPVLVSVLTALAAVVVVLTRVRLHRGQGAARVVVARRLVDLHTVCGALATVVWVAFLVAPDDTVVGGAVVGVVGLGLWWVVTVAGLAMLTRWLPARGRHASDGPRDRWSAGPWLSLLAHLGMVVAVVVFSYAYLTAAV